MDVNYITMNIISVRFVRVTNDIILMKDYVAILTLIQTAATAIKIHVLVQVPISKLGNTNLT